jgi:hypothetical protein
LIASITIIGFFINKNKIGQIFIGSLAGAVYFFLISNFMVWIGGGWDINNQPYPRSFSGLMLCFSEALPFFKWSVLSTLLFNGAFLRKFLPVRKECVEKRNAGSLKVIRINYLILLLLGERIFILRDCLPCFQSLRPLLAFRSQRPSVAN